MNSFPIDFEFHKEEIKHKHKYQNEKEEQSHSHQEFRAKIYENFKKAQSEQKEYCCINLGHDDYSVHLSISYEVFDRFSIIGYVLNWPNNHNLPGERKLDDGERYLSDTGHQLLDDHNIYILPLTTNFAQKIKDSIEKYNTIIQIRKPKIENINNEIKYLTDQIANMKERINYLESLKQKLINENPNNK